MTTTVTVRRKRREITEQEITEYMVRKAQRKAAKAAEMLKAQTMLRSSKSNHPNSFGDSNLNEKFVWPKKIELDIENGVTTEEYSVKAEKKRQRERMAELEKVKKRREERGREKEQRGEETAMLARERARAEFQDWERNEEEFEFDQSKVRSLIRLRNGRSKPIDILVKHVDVSNEFDTKIDEPYLVFKGLTIKELEELHDDIKLHLKMDGCSPTRFDYWEALLEVCVWELAEAEARRKDALEVRGMHSGIEACLHNSLEGKTSAELETLRCQIESKMSSGTAHVVEFWETVLKRLKLYKAKAYLKEIHANMFRKHEPPSRTGEELENDDHDVIPRAEEAGSFSPELLHCDDNEEVVDPEEDKAVLERKRSVVREEQRERLQEPTASKAMRSMGDIVEGDAVFGSGAEVDLSSEVYWWHDKYRPRKPKYLNRVHTGYEWNKYNQTHYDHDNPPPKMVQGYKFNIFYPDLVDKTKAPEYTLVKDGNSNETCILKFHAGPLYEDIAFRIVNNPWEMSRKKGFKSTAYCSWTSTWSTTIIADDQMRPVQRHRPLGCTKEQSVRYAELGNGCFLRGGLLFC